MKKIIITLALAFIGTVAYSQTYTKIVVKGDTCLKIVETKTTTDTLKRKQIKEELQKIKTARQANKDSRKTQIAEFDRLEAYYAAEIDRLKLLLLKTD